MVNFITISPPLVWHPCLNPSCLKRVLHGDRISPGEWSKPESCRQVGVTPLIAATRKGQRDVVAVLLQHGADVSPVSLDMSQSALQEAIERGHTGITTMLMKATAKVSYLGTGGEKWGVKQRERERKNNKRWRRRGERGREVKGAFWEHHWPWCALSFHQWQDLYMVWMSDTFMKCIWALPLAEAQYYSVSSLVMHLKYRTD